jgi:hypothetical protein
MLSLCNACGLLHNRSRCVPMPIHHSVIALALLNQFGSAGLRCQVHVRRSTFAPLHAERVQAANPFLAVRWLGGS